MTYVALVFSVLSFILSLTAVILVIVLIRRRDRPSGASAWNDELLTRDAWLEELEERGRAVLARIEQAERRVASRNVHRPPASSAEEVAAAGERSGQTSGEDAEPETALQKAAVQAEVRRLAAEGHDVDAIARRLRLGRGEVELFLGLPDRARTPNDG